MEEGISERPSVQDLLQIIGGLNVLSKDVTVFRSECELLVSSLGVLETFLSEIESSETRILEMIRSTLDGLKSALERATRALKNVRLQSKFKRLFLKKQLAGDLSSSTADILRWINKLPWGQFKTSLWREEDIGQLRLDVQRLETRIQRLKDPSPSHTTQDDDDEDGLAAELKEVIRAYEEAPKSTEGDTVLGSLLECLAKRLDSNVSTVIREWQEVRDEALLLRQEMQMTGEKKREMEQDFLAQITVYLDNCINIQSEAAAPTFPVDPPDDFCCGICHDIMEDPVVCPSEQSFCRACITEWFRINAGNETCPVTMMKVPPNLFGVFALRNLIRRWQTTVTEQHPEDIEEPVGISTGMSESVEQAVNEGRTLSLSGPGSRSTGSTTPSAGLLISSLDSASSSAEIRGILRRLSSIAQQSSGKWEIYSAKGIPIIARLLRSEDSDVVEKAADVLENITFQRTGDNSDPLPDVDRKELLTCVCDNALDSLIDGMHMGNSNTRLAAARTVICLLANDGTREAVRRRDGVVKGLLWLADISSGVVRESKGFSLCITGLGLLADEEALCRAFSHTDQALTAALVRLAVGPTASPKLVQETLEALRYVVEMLSPRVVGTLLDKNSLTCLVHMLRWPKSPSERSPRSYPQPKVLTEVSKNELLIILDLLSKGEEGTAHFESFKQLLVECDSILDRGRMAEELEQQALKAYLDDDYEEAVHLYKKAIALDPSNPQLYCGRAAVLIKQESYMDAVADAKEAIKLNPSLSKAHFRKGEACYHLEEYPTAKAAFEAGLKVDPKNSKIQTWITKCDDRLRGKMTTGWETEPSAKYPSSAKKGARDWNRLEAEIKKKDRDEKLEGDAALKKLFQDIYSNADEDTRRAMNKSFVESNGTVLSTNRKEVGSKEVEKSPPKGMELKKWEHNSIEDESQWQGALTKLEEAESGKEESLHGTSLITVCGQILHGQQRYECTFHPSKADTLTSIPTATTTRSCGFASSSVQYANTGDTMEMKQVSLRPDVIALGFHQFEGGFDSKKILAMKIESEMDDTVELSFFHMEGMAAIFGIGIPFSVVRLTKMGGVEIEEVGEQIWRQSWTDSSVQSGDMVIFEDQSSNPVRQPSPVPVDLTEQQAAEKFGIAVEGMSYFQPTNDSEKYPSTAHELIPPHEWMKSLFDLLRENHMVCAEGWKETNVEVTETDVEPTDVVGGTVGSGFGSTDTGGSAGQKPLLLDVLNMASGDSIENQPRLADSDNLKEEKLEVKQLTVVIRWRMDSLKFYCCCDRGNELQLRERDSRCAELFDPVSQNVLTGSPNLSDCEVVPVVKVEFLCGSGPMDEYEDGEKRFITTLSGSFHNKPHSADQHTNLLHQFGWFHDNLSLSFKCKRRNAVEQEVKDLEDEVLTAHERRTDGGAYGEEASGSLTSTIGGQLSLSGGMPSTLTARANLYHTRQRVVGNKTTQSSSTQAWFSCLKESNFSIHRESSRSELCYVAKIFPPLAAYDMTRPRDWFTATRNGMMETIRIDIKGVWLVLDDDGDSNEHMFCPYEFLCRRYLFLRRSESSVKQTKDRNRSLFSRQQQESSRRPDAADVGHATTGLTLLKEEKIQQKLGRNFLLNHSFSHLRRFRRPEVYKWSIKDQNEAPHEIRKIMY